MDLLYRDITEYLLEWISPIEAIQLRYVSKSWKHVVKPQYIASIFRKNLINAIISVCHVSKLDATQLIKNADKHSGVISGSIILQALYSIDYENSDIDIFFPPTIDNVNVYYDVLGIERFVLREATDFYRKEGKFLTLDYYKDTPCLLNKLREGYPILESKYGNSFKSNRNTPVCHLFYNNKHLSHAETKYSNIQLIKLETWNRITPHECVVDAFDVSVCMNSFSNGVFETYSIKRLIAKEMIIFKSTARVCKYEDRGFKHIELQLNEFNLRALTHLSFSVRQFFNTGGLSQLKDIGAI